MLGSLVLYLRGMRILMFQLSGFYYSVLPTLTSEPVLLGRRILKGRPAGKRSTDSGLGLQVLGFLK